MRIREALIADHGSLITDRVTLGTDADADADAGMMWRNDQ